MHRGCVQDSLEPVTWRPAVVVSECDQRRMGRAQRDVALPPDAARAGRQAEVTQRAALGEWMLAQEGLGLRPARIMRHQHFPALAREGLLSKRIEQPAQPHRTLVGGDRHRDLDRVGPSRAHGHRRDYETGPRRSTRRAHRLAAPASAPSRAATTSRR